MKHVFFVLSLGCGTLLLAQPKSYEQAKFCKNFFKVVELARTDNLDAYDATVVKQSAFLAVPGYSIKLERFPVAYVDKEKRFVGKTNLNLDSLSALVTLDEFRTYVGYCFDSTNWLPWFEKQGEDSATVFFKETKSFFTYDSSGVRVQIAMVNVSSKVYSINMYIQKLNFFWPVLLLFGFLSPHSRPFFKEQSL